MAVTCFLLALIFSLLPLLSIAIESNETTTDFPSVCLDQTLFGAPVKDVLACYGKLNNATLNCEVPGPPAYRQVFCTAGNAMIVGENIGTASGGTSSSW